MELYLYQNGEQFGPYTEDQISSMLTSGALSRDDLVWHEGLTEWQPLHVIFSLPAPVAPLAPARQAIRQCGGELIAQPATAPTHIAPPTTAGNSPATKGNSNSTVTAIGGLIGAGVAAWYVFGGGTEKQVVGKPAQTESVRAIHAQENGLTSPQKNSIRSAKQYLSISGFSRSGLIKQLSSDAGDGYSVADTTAAVDSLNVDWNEQAVRSAKQYLSISGFSCKGLIEQLSSSAGDGYTVSEATYGAQQAGACE
jgi:hypothetical protein